MKMALARPGSSRIKSLRIDARKRDQALKDYEIILNELRKSFEERWKLSSTSSNVCSDGNALKQFVKIRTLGTGAFGRVMLVKKDKEEEYYAMKILDKAKIVKQKQV